jgi:hypothetical protein
MANENADPKSVSDKLDGLDPSGGQLPWRKVAMFFEAHAFGLSKDYAFPEGANESAAALDHVASLAKLLTRKRTLADGNQYDGWDMLLACTKYVLSQNIHIMDDEPLSVNYKKPASS